MIQTRFATVLVAIAIPLGSGQDWQDLKYSKIKPNTNQFTPNGLNIAVDSSASPLIYPLKHYPLITAFETELEITGDINPVKAQFPEDAYFRLGLVVPGKRRLNAFERAIAAPWVKTLFALAPKDGGVDRIQFYNVIPPETVPVNEERRTPHSRELMHERVIAIREAGQKSIRVKHQLGAPLPTAALWISVDGDQTKSKYSVLVKSLKLEIKPPDLEKSE